MTRGKIIPFPRAEHERFGQGLRRSFPVWYEGEAERRRWSDRACQLVVVVCLAVCAALAWGWVP